jgi:hypothetical protein
VEEEICREKLRKGKKDSPYIQGLEGSDTHYRDERNLKPLKSFPQESGDKYGISINPE